MNRAYLERNGVRVESVVAAARNDLLVPVTPMLVLVRADGTVVNSWRGRLSASGEQELLKALDHP